MGPWQLGPTFFLVGKPALVHTLFPTPCVLHASSDHWLVHSVVSFLFLSVFFRKRQGLSAAEEKAENNQH